MLISDELHECGKDSDQKQQKINLTQKNPHMQINIKGEKDIIHTTKRNKYFINKYQTKMMK